MSVSRVFHGCDQDQRMRQILARMETQLSYGTTQAFDSTGSRSKASGGDRPSGDSSPAHELYRVLYDRCGTDEERENVITAAEKELGPGSTLVEPGNLPWKREIANSEEPVERILRLYGISRATYYRYRRDYRS